LPAFFDDYTKNLNTMANRNTRPVARTDFASAVAQISSERNLDASVILDTIKQAILVAFKKDHPDQIKDGFHYEVTLDSASGEARVQSFPGEEYTEEEVVKIRAQAGSKPTDVTPPGFGRIAAQSARQVIFQKIHEAEKSVIVAEYQKRIGSLASGTIVRFVGGEVIADLGKTEAVMPISEQVHSEDYRLNARFTFFLKEIRESPRGREIVISRTDDGLIKELFKREVPEVNSQAVEIRAIARDPGSRTKIAVYSRQSGVDPVGSCVGQKGVRVQNVISELNNEKVDIVQFSEDLEKFVIASLSPAENLNVKVNPKTQNATVTAPADQLPLAIGREGQNAKLAGKLTGLHIDIKPSDSKDQTPSSNDQEDHNEPAV